MCNKSQYIALLLTFALQGCTETFHVEDIQHAPAVLPTLSSAKFFVANKELAFEYAIFRQSGLFSEAETDSDATKVMLHPIQPLGTCGMAMLGSMLFLGTIPITLPHEAIYTFTTSKDGQANRYEFELSLYSRYSIWEWIFKPFNSEAEEYALALRNQIKPE